MRDSDRLNQLRVMRDRLARLEASPERDWMLSEVRRRAVDVESEGRSTPLRPLVLGPEVEPEPAPPPKRVASPPRPKPPQPAPRLAAVAPPAATPVPEGLLLCLDDEVPVSPAPRPEGAMVPWARGLRG
jgi:hypothetical protein